jgi:hypothetical protein
MNNLKNLLSKLSIIERIIIIISTLYLIFFLLIYDNNLDFKLLISTPVLIFFLSLILIFIKNRYVYIVLLVLIFIVYRDFNTLIQIMQFPFNSISYQINLFLLINSIILNTIIVFMMIFKNKFEGRSSIWFFLILIPLYLHQLYIFTFFTLLTLNSFEFVYMFSRLIVGFRYLFTAVTAYSILPIIFILFIYNYNNKKTTY